jgi:hypothetical protein
MQYQEPPTVFPQPAKRLFPVDPYRGTSSELSMPPSRPLIHVLLPHTIVAPFVVHLRTATATILEASKAPITRPHGLTITTCRETCR